ncbi:GD17539 [Drosophila simulans]|uniref:GD17539 n=1 Tax=Drosophila simulans TaxID=7240 RepID=B4R3S4_DROSI|nr:GD17539 [Drosophila simulans]
MTAFDSDYDYDFYSSPTDADGLEDVSPDVNTDADANANANANANADADANADLCRAACSFHAIERPSMAGHPQYSVK